jgi:hypothetical protein
LAIIDHGLPRRELFHYVTGMPFSPGYQLGRCFGGRIALWRKPSDLVVNLPRLFNQPRFQEREQPRLFWLRIINQ